MGKFADDTSLEQVVIIDGKHTYKRAGVLGEYLTAVMC